MLPLSTVQGAMAGSPASTVSNGLALGVPSSKLPLVMPVTANVDPASDIDATSAKAALTIDRLFTRFLLSVSEMGAVRGCPENVLAPTIYSGFGRKLWYYGHAMLAQ